YMLISSETSFRALDPIRQAGAIAILPKPFEREQLEHALYNTVEIIDPQALEFEDQAPEELEVLVVDDSSTARRYIMRVLNGLGIEKITQAKNGVEAIEIMKGAYFDFIVTDYNMPEMDGQELVKQVRNQSAQASIPIIMVTSETDESRLAAVQNTGVSAICDKPFEPNTVRGLIENILHH
ncbi:MAG: response regulator, partial [Gammaproteobacteria bacterium]